LAVNEEPEGGGGYGLERVAIESFREVDGDGLSVGIDGGVGENGWSGFVVVDGGGVIDDLSEGLDVVASVILKGAGGSGRLIGDKDGLSLLDGGVVGESNEELAHASGSGCSRRGVTGGVGAALDGFRKGEGRAVRGDETACCGAHVLDLNGVRGEEGGSSVEGDA